MNALAKLRREVGHGGTIPSGWRLAWYEPRRRVGVYFPAPLHWALRAWRELAYRLRLAMRAPRIECAQVFELQRAHHYRQELSSEYARGYMAGWHECFDACLVAVEDELSRSGDMWELGSLLAEADAPDQGRKN
jgi:hypothetical protein